MKNLQTMFISMLMMLIYSSTIYGQKLMKLDDELKANSKPIEAKRKGMSSIGKYEFGPYKIVSGKGGWGTTTSKKNFFSFETKSESKTKLSFVFVANEKDTILVNTATNTKFSQSDFSFGDLSTTTLNQSIDNFIAMISPGYDTTVWKMVLVSRSGAEVEGNYTAEGILTNGPMNIQIRTIKQWEDGKNPVFKMICGYEFFIDNNSIAAVQANLNLTPKKFVWLHQNLDEKMKSILAAASASIMIYTDEAQSDKGN